MSTIVHLDMRLLRHLATVRDRETEPEPHTIEMTDVVLAALLKRVQ